MAGSSNSTAAPAPPPAARLEMTKCCGTSCDKGLAVRQIAKLSQIWKALRAPLLRTYTDRVCYVRDEDDRITGVFVPLAMVEDLFNDKAGKRKS